MELNRETLLRAYPDLPPQVDVRMERTLTQLEHTAPLKAQRAAPRRFSFATAFALCLLAAALGVAAGAHFDVFDFMAGWFGQTGMLPQAHELVETPAAALDLPHATLRLQEALYDGSVLRVVYSVTPKHGFALSQAIEADSICLDGCDSFAINGEEIVMTGGSTATYTVTDETAFCYLQIELASAGIAPTAGFTVGLPLAGEQNAKQALTFPVSTTYAAQTPTCLETETTTVTLKDASLSPVRAYVQLRIERNASATAQDFATALGDWEDAVLATQNGTVLSTLESLEITAQKEGEWVEYTCVFLPTDADEVYFAPTRITPQDECLPNMAHAIRIR